MLQLAAARERIKSLSAQLSAAGEQASKDAEARIASLTSQHNEEKSTLETVIQAMESESRALSEQLDAANAQCAAALKRCADIEQASSGKILDAAAKIQELEARLDESQAANAEMQRSYQRQVQSVSLLMNSFARCHRPVDADSRSE